MNDPDLVADVDGLGLVRPVLLLDGDQVGVRGHGECRPQGQHSLVTCVQGLQHRLVSEMNTVLEQDAVFKGSDCIDSYFDALSAL